MGIAEVVAIASLSFAIALPLLSARRAEDKAKGRSETIEKSTNDAIDDLKREQSALAVKMHEIDKAAALDHQTVDGFCDRLDKMGEHVDKRFDKIEAMISKGR